MKHPIPTLGLHNLKYRVRERKKIQLSSHLCREYAIARPVQRSLRSQGYYDFVLDGLHKIESALFTTDYRTQY